MTVGAKICGLTTREAVAAVAAGGAAYAGFVFYPPSPRNLQPQQAAALAAGLPPTIKKVAVLVDPKDDDIARVLAAFSPDLIQLHGHETVQRTAAVRARFGRPVIKAIAISSQEDVEKAMTYEKAADLLLFDAKAPTSMAGALPGGNGLIFDWQLIAAAPKLAKPWLLSGGLEAANVGAAIATARAKLVDVSSGVEDRPGVKSPQKIRDFLAAVAAQNEVAS